MRSEILATNKIHNELENSLLVPHCNIMHVPALIQIISYSKYSLYKLL
jgi:hypothetical protein